MIKGTVASYLPDSQLIKLGVKLPAFSDPQNPRGFVGGHEIAYVLHEWTHYLHNVSTIHGLSSFANLVHLWSVFRRTIGPDGLSGGSIAHSDEIRMHFKQKNAFIFRSRSARINRLPGEVIDEFVTVAEVSERSLDLPGLDVQTSVIVCELNIGNDKGDSYSSTVEIGPHEIVESVAYMLEERFTVRGGGEPAEVSFAPYRLLKVLASHIAPHLTEELVIACGIASLQSSDPPSSLRKDLALAEADVLEGRDAFALLQERQREELRNASAWIDENLLLIETIFPLDEPMARAIRKTASVMRSNFEVRTQHPFFEFDILQVILAYPNGFTTALNAFGACGILQQRPGFDDDVQRDLLYEFVLDDVVDLSLQEGRRLMHAAFDFIRLHSSDGEILPTLELPKARRNKCPFYTSCDKEARKVNPRVCAEEPWLTAHQPSASLCWYGLAVRLISPLAIAAQLERRFPPLVNP